MIWFLTNRILYEYKNLIDPSTYYFHPNIAILILRVDLKKKKKYSFDVILIRIKGTHNVDIIFRPHGQPTVTKINKFGNE